MSVKTRERKTILFILKAQVILNYNNWVGLNGI